jgi:hypothetical protein
VLSMRTRTKIIFHGFTRLRFHESMVIRADDGASALHVDLSGVLRPCRLWNNGIAGHNWKDENGGGRCTRVYLSPGFGPGSGSGGKLAED